MSATKLEGFLGPDDGKAEINKGGSRQQFESNSQNENPSGKGDDEIDDESLYQEDFDWNLADRRVSENKAPKSKRNCCVSCCKAFLQTKQVISSKNVDRETYIQSTLLELGIYGIYICLCSTIVFGMISPTDYYFTKVLSDLFLDTPFNDQSQITFRTSANIKHFWDFTETSMLNGLYWEEWYDDKNINKPVDKKDRAILYENKLLGKPRLRQIRVKSTTCLVDQLVNALGGADCYTHYEPSFEDTGNYNDRHLNDSAYNYQSADKLGGRKYWGKLSTYTAGGVHRLLDCENSIKTLDMILELKEELWVHRSTRVVFLEFTVYNANINMFCVVKLAWEFSVTGGIIPSWSLRAVRLIRYVSNFDYFILGCEIAFIVYTLYYTIQGIIEIWKLGILKYLSDFWSYLDMLLLTLSYICIAFSIYRYVLIKKTMPGFTPSSRTEGECNDKFADYDFLAFWESQFNNGISICLFFVWIRIFKYISFNVTMSQLSITLSRCAKDVLGFGIMFFIVFFAFAQLGYLLFGSQVQDFSSIQESIFSLLRLILGDFDFEAIEAANRVLGPIYFLAYVFFVFFVLLNMFLAIINDTYSEVKAEIQGQRSEFLISDYIKEKIFVSKKSTGEATVPSFDKVVDDGKITHAEIRNHLLNAHYTESEVDLFITRYELNKDLILDKEETENFIENLKNGIQTDDNHGDENMPSAETKIEKLDTKIITLETSFSTVLENIEKVVSKMNREGNSN